jgi:hypothetical protein
MYEFYGLAHALVGRAATKIADRLKGQGLARRSACQQTMSSHDKTWLTVSALSHIKSLPSINESLAELVFDSG